MCITEGRPVQYPGSSIIKPCCFNRCRMWFNIILLKYTRPKKRRHRIGTYLALRTCIYLWWHSSCASCQIHIHLKQLNTIGVAGIWTEHWWKVRRSLFSSDQRMLCPCFPKRTSNFNSGDHRTVFHFDSVHFKSNGSEKKELFLAHVCIWLYWWLLIDFQACAFYTVFSRFSQCFDSMYCSWWDSFFVDWWSSAHH